MLPNGDRIAVVCATQRRPTTDADGHAGFDAPADGATAPTVVSRTYDRFGRITTQTDALGHVTRYDYYADTAATHTKGDLRSIVDAAGHITLFQRYGPAGQLLEMTDANGVVSSFTYDARHRITSVSTAGHTTTYSWWPTGRLRRITAPDGLSFLQFDYDADQRLIRVSNQLGHRIEYLLDGAGQRFAEHVIDANNILRRQLQRSFDALGRVQQVTGREPGP